jgi:hypothetical protein
MISRLDKAQRLEHSKSTAVNAEQSAVVYVGAGKSDHGVVPPVIEEAQAIQLLAEASEAVEPTDLESYLRALDGALAAAYHVRPLMVVLTSPLLPTDGQEISSITLPALGIGDDGLAQLLDRLPPLKLVHILNSLHPIRGLLT